MNKVNQKIKQEIEHGRYLSARNSGKIWNWDSPESKLRWKRRIRLLISHITSEMSVLEVGCGTGYLTRELVKTGADIYAIDISPELLAQAKSYCEVENVTYMIENACDMSFDPDRFDSVVGSSVLHHLGVDSALREFFRVLKPQGSLFFTEPNMLNPQIALQKNIPYLKRKLGDSPDETAFFRRGLKNKLVSAGFAEVVIEPFDFLHPSIPKALISFVQPLCRLAEKTPGLSEFSGSLYIRAVKPK